LSLEKEKCGDFSRVRSEFGRITVYLSMPLDSVPMAVDPVAMRQSAALTLLVRHCTFSLPAWLQLDAWRIHGTIP